MFIYYNLVIICGICALYFIKLKFLEIFQSRNRFPCGTNRFPIVFSRDIVFMFFRNRFPCRDEPVPTYLFQIFFLSLWLYVNSCFFFFIFSYFILLLIFI